MLEDVVHTLSGRLETLAQTHISIARGLDFLERTSTSCREFIVVNVMRESLNEVVHEELVHAFK